ncbi:DMT family transporter [Pseudoduganella chitinolytica]|uniref:DMT family transporter n=1 Tax=Pseudoduganella chitinolytica TaxID=34070 RepID=A0ABY8BDS7_9BURK|nr:DMT family transporter [Pseudoduganella chitinolytica]WEF33148.1 DMT family transporter [Pseudoduganella chitinolytica]
MSTANLLRLFLLAAIWGGSFLFMRIAAPALGPGWLIELRVVFAALFLAAIAVLLKKSLHIRRYWRHYLILGLFNAAIPFVLFAYAAKTLSASLLSVLNATAPMWAALIAAMWQRQMVSSRVLLGLVLGTLGVALLVGMDRLSTQDGALLAIGAALLAPFNYGIATVYAKSAPAVEPFSNAHGSMWAGAVLTLPALLMFPQPAMPSPGILGAALALGVLCSGVAYLLYYGLIRDVGATSALTVTFLSPLFGILWGVLFLHEIVGWYTLAGAALVIAGVVLVTGYRPAWSRRAVSA